MGGARCPAALAPPTPQVLYILWCIVLLDVLHDAWFYWTHRLLHWRPLYRHIHFEHHR
jgi:sterol desaturase/sphingolipid hydroxylase (fatty acid hydroxylase superfamily)